jgi:hypothetical protein
MKRPQSYALSRAATGIGLALGLMAKSNKPLELGIPDLEK